MHTNKKKLVRENQNKDWRSRTANGRIEHIGLGFGSMLWNTSHTSHTFIRRFSCQISRNFPSVRDRDTIRIGLGLFDKKKSDSNVKNGNLPCASLSKRHIWNIKNLSDTKLGSSSILWYNRFERFLEILFYAKFLELRPVLIPTENLEFGILQVGITGLLYITHYNQLWTMNRTRGCDCVCE